MAFFSQFHIEPLSSNQGHVLKHKQQKEQEYMYIEQEEQEQEHQQQIQQKSAFSNIVIPTHFINDKRSKKKRKPQPPKMPGLPVKMPLIQRNQDRPMKYQFEEEQEQQPMSDHKPTKTYVPAIVTTMKVLTPYLIFDALIQENQYRVLAYQTQMVPFVGQAIQVSILKRVNNYIVVDDIL